MAPDRQLQELQKSIAGWRDSRKGVQSGEEMGFWLGLKGRVDVWMVADRTGRRKCRHKNAQTCREFSRVSLSQTGHMLGSKISNALENSFAASFMHLNLRRKVRKIGESRAGAGLKDS